MQLARWALAAVAIFTFPNAWNHYLQPTVYLSTPGLFTLPASRVATDTFSGL
jgi:multiple sugar transport system permease protein